MPIRNAIARLAIADARRFEQQALERLRAILDDCPDDSTRTVIAEIFREEESHLAHLDEACRGMPACAAPAPVEPPAPGATPPLPPAPPPEGPICQKLRSLLAMEEASIHFYAFLGERTLIPVVRDIFRHITDEERAHAAKLRAHIDRLCGPEALKGRQVP